MVISIQLLFMHVPEIENTGSLLLYGKTFFKKITKLNMCTGTMIAQGGDCPFCMSMPRARKVF